MTEQEHKECAKKARKKRIQKKRILKRRILIGMVFFVVFIFGFILFCCSKKDIEKKRDENDQISVEQNKTQEQVQQDEVFQEPEVSLIMVGDILLHENVQESGKLSDGTYNYDHMFEYIKDDVQAADIAIANQEVILGGTEIGLYGYPNFNGPFEVGDALVDAGFNVILHATNHTLDHGKSALVNCLDFWKTKHSDVAVLGVFESQDAYDNDIYVFEEDGLKIVILNYTYGTNGMPFPIDMPFAVAMLEENKVIADLQKANEIADFIVVCPHWGTEYRHEQSREQEYWAELFMENGVDLVIGTHPHYIQPVEMLIGENGEEMLVYYSLGNYINSTGESGRGTADRMIGGMAQVTVAKTETGKAYIKEYGVEPLVTQLSYGTQEITTYKLDEYTETLASQNRILDKDDVFSLEFCQELCRDVFGELY